MTNKRQLGVTPRKKTKKSGLKPLTILAVFVVMSVSVLGAWQIIINGATINANVVSSADEVLVIQSDFQDIGQVNTSISGQTVVRNMTLNNLNGEMEFQFLANVTIIDDISDNCNNAGDITVSFVYEDLDIVSGDIINVTSGLSTITMNADYVKFACPSNMTISTQLIEIIA